MTNRIVYVLLVCIPVITSAQSRIVFNNDPWLVMNNNVFLVINNSNANAITMAGSGGRIISEAENNRIRWMIGTAIGNYSIPFADNVGEGGTKIPLWFIIGTAGVGAGYIDFSTYDGAVWDNALYMPSMVSHMGQYNSPNAPNNSQKAIDRFWIMNPIGYGTKPAPSQIVFTYIDNEHTAPGNSITETALGAQRFNNGTGQWGDMLPIGLVNTVANTVTTPGIVAANYFAAWTLSDSNDPLPVTLLSYTAECHNEAISLKWVTASEQNSSHFTLYKAIDNTDFSFLTHIPAAGRSASIQEYSYTDSKSPGKTYYKLTQTDVDGYMQDFGIVHANCAAEYNLDIVHVSVQQDRINALFAIPETGTYELVLTDILGKIVYSEKLSLNKGNQVFSLPQMNLAGSLYFITLRNETALASKKFVALR